ncbi:DUF4153 domain-containing protein [Cohnella herbarum]|uniref:DUF4173 domain-containing protein n=1 Tax=Cohnella herbarum TaxID=2728023 RepID=A0A7Z2VLX1_9BACL|nr:DUF4173 domain-containing protein [Cohnella herbarum]QJD85464.1 DUF4173 domain-containing protein [Cohnella herbarum]
MIYLNTIRKPLGRSTAALIGAFVLAIAHQYLFYDNVPGVSYPLFVILLYTYLFHDWRDRLREISGFGWFLFVVVLLLSVTYGLFSNPILYALNLVVVPILIFIHTAYLRGVNQSAWWKFGIVNDALDHLLSQSLRHLPTVFRIFKISVARKMGAEQKSTLGKVFIGLLIAVPLLIIVISLLASADGVFNRFVNGAPEWMNSLSIGEGLSRGIWIIVCGVLFFCYLWGFVKPKRAKTGMAGISGKLEESANRGTAKIDPIILTTLLLSVNAVYVLFVAVQFSYLFGAWDGGLPDGKTYAEYARSGFVELVIVTVINFALLMITLVRGDMTRRRIAALLYILIGCSGVMLYSAYMRLVLYEEAYGYTYIRFLVHAFMIYLAVMLVIAAVRVRMRILPLAKCYIVISLAAYVFINYVGMDRLIAENNIERYQETGKIDLQYLSGLSADAIPTLVNFSEQEYPGPGMKTLLVNKWETIKVEDRRWPSFNVSIFRAEKALNEIAGMPH